VAVAKNHKKNQFNYNSKKNNQSFTSLISFETKASFRASLSTPGKTTGHELYRRLRHDVKCSMPAISSVHPSGTSNKE